MKDVKMDLARNPIREENRVLRAKLVEAEERERMLFSWVIGMGCTASIMLMMLIYCFNC